MSETKHRHHFIPRFYLSGFTPTGDKKDFLNVFDIDKQERRRARPDTVAHIRDFYRVDQDDVNPNAVEDAFAEIEGQVSTIISKLTSSPIVPLEEPEYQTLMYFIALLVVRVPSMRKEQERMMVDISRRMMEMSVLTHERWNSCVQQMNGEDAVLPTAEEYQSMRDFVMGGDYKLSVGRNFLVGTVIELAESLAPLLLQRKWRLLVAEDGTEFITSDRPVVISWADESPGNWGPGLGAPNSVVTVPLHRRMALLGIFEGENVIMTAGALLVATVNLTTAMHADRYVFASNENFQIGDKTGKIGNGAELLFNRRRREDSGKE